jgi:hypothetical protein
LIETGSAVLDLPRPITLGGGLANFERCVRHEVAWVAVLTNGIGTKLSVLPLIPYWDMRPE